MYNGRATINTATGVFLIAVMAAGCLFLVAQLKHYTALADTIAMAEEVYVNNVYNFSLAIGSGWPRLTVIEKKASTGSSLGPARRIHFMLPTEDAYYLNGFSQPLVLNLYPRGRAAQLGLETKPNYLGEGDNYAFTYELWEEAPSDLERIYPRPEAVIGSFELLK